MWFYSNFRTRNAKLSYKGTKNVSIYAFSLGKSLDFRKYACVKDLTNIVSERDTTDLIIIISYWIWCRFWPIFCVVSRQQGDVVWVFSVEIWQPSLLLEISTDLWAWGKFIDKPIIKYYLLDQINFWILSENKKKTRNKKTAFPFLLAKPSLIHFVLSVLRKVSLLDNFWLHL